MNKAGLNSVPEFPDAESVGPRDWGEEILVSLVPEKFMMKKLYINKGSKGGLQYHRLKDEVHVIIKGKMLITYDDGTGNLVDKVLEVGTGCGYSAAVLASICRKLYTSEIIPQLGERAKQALSDFENVKVLGKKVLYCVVN